jgi:hypothetical protein
MVFALAMTAKFLATLAFEIHGSGVEEDQVVNGGRKVRRASLV